MFENINIKLVSFKVQFLKSYKLMMLATAASYVLINLITSLQSALGIYLLVVLGFQYLISISGKFISKINPLIHMQNEYKKHIRIINIKPKTICLWLSASSLFFLFTPYLPFLILLVCMIFYAQGLYDLINSFVNPEGKVAFYKKRLFDYNPEVAIYVSGLAKVAYQVNQWIPVLEKMPFRCVIIIRNKGVFKGIVGTEIPIYYAKSMRELEYFEEAGVRVSLYPANTQQNVQFLRLFNIQHVFINHGESDKVVNQSKFLMAYDYLFLGGELAKRRLLDAGLPVRNNQVELVGRPQTELLLSRKKATETSIKRILYAPTWEGFVEEANYSSVSPLGYKMIEELLSRDDIIVIFKPHPYTGTYGEKNREYLKKMKNLCDGEQLIFMNNDSDIYQLMNESDMLISDVSSVVNEYLYTLKPIVVANPKCINEKDFNEKFPTTRAAYIYGSNSDIIAIINDIESKDVKKDARVMVCEDSLGCIEESSVKKFEYAISKHL